DAAPMRVRQRAEDVAKDDDDVADGQCTVTVESLSERLAFDERHRVVQHRAGFTRREDRYDVRVLKAREQVNFATKALDSECSRQFGGKHFHDDGTAERALAGDEEVAHAAATELSLDDE